MVSSLQSPSERLEFLEAIRFLEQNGDVVLDVIHARCRPGGRLGFVPVVPGADGSGEVYLAAFCTDPDRLRVEPRSMQRQDDVVAEV
jgi:hypothetical protein